MFLSTHMPGWYLVISLFLAIASPCVQAARPQTEQQTIDGVTFSVPQGLRIEKVAGSPLVERPIVASWDSQGRLLVLEAAGPVARENESQGSRPHRLVRLVDDDCDGRFDRRIVAAEELSFPVGVLAIGNKVLVSAPPQIWELSDEDGDGVCERREIWFDPGTATHCYNDLHGPYLGRDGWIYWTKGAFAAQSFTLRDGEPFTSTAAHIYRRRLAGGPIESVMTGGMDNPVELAITRDGERFFTSTFLQYPAGGKRDGIAHAVYGGRYGKVHEVLNNHWSTGDFLPIMTHLGPAAPSGLALIEKPDLLQDSSLRPAAQQAELPALVAAQFNLQRISLHRLVPQGATFRTEDQTLLATDWVQFHPTDILEDVDGSLLVFDTGGWYDLCCPSLALDQSVAVGGIYRLTSKATRAGRLAGPSKPKNYDEAVNQFLASSAWLKRRAAEWLVSHPEATSGKLVQAMKDPQCSLSQRQEFLWLLCQIGDPVSRKAIVSQLSAADPGMRQAAAMAVAVHRWSEATALQAALRGERNLAVMRALAEALGRVGDSSSVASIMEALARIGADADSILRHSLTYALIELNQSDEIAEFLRSTNPAQREAALRALHERSDSRLNTAAILAAVNSDATRNTAMEILLAHPEWSPELGEHWPQMFARAERNASDREALFALARHWDAEPSFQAFVLTQLKSADSATPESLALLLELISTTRIERLPSDWNEELAKLLLKLETTDPSKLPKLLEWLCKVSLSSDEDKVLVSALLTLGEKDSAFAVLALACLPVGTEATERQVEKLVKSLETVQAEERSRLTWLALLRLRLDGPRLERIAATADSWELGNAELSVQLFAEQADEELNLTLLKQLEQLPLSKVIAPEQFRELYRPCGERVQAALEGMLGRLIAPAADTVAAVDRLLAQLPEGEALRGMQVFRSTRAACSSCHQIAYVGGQIGPDLSRIGATRSRRELLEAIAFPSNRQEQGYRSEKFGLADGRVVSGLVEERDGNSLVVRSGVEQRTRFRLDEIEERLPSELSLMPAGIIDVLTPQQLADLLAFLESRR